MKELELSFDISTKILESCLDFLLRVARIKKIAFGRAHLDTVWITDVEQLPRHIVAIVEEIDRLLTEISVAPISEIDLLIEVNKKLKKNQRINLDQLRQMLDLCGSIEKKTDGYYWGKFEYLDSRGNQVERILLERGEPLHISEIVRELNHRMSLLGKRTVTERNVGNQISSDSRFTAVGRSGEWGLRSWSLDTSTIIDLMRQALATRNEPLTAEEIYNYVSERRPVSTGSINAYLTFNDSFSRVSRDRWGLSSWSETKNAQIWGPVQVSQFVQELFKKHKARKLQYRLVKAALIEATGLNAKQVQGMLNISPALITERDASTGELIAIFQPDYGKKLDQVSVQRRRKTKTLRETVSEYVRQELENAPGNQVTLGELTSQLVKRFSRPIQTFYHYISDLEFVEKFAIPDTRITMCRLKREHKAFPFSQVENIQTSDLKQKVGRALTFLNESDVDISLFLLSKEFEATLKQYLLTAYSKGHFRHLSSGNPSLDQMINFIEKEGIVTDKAILHFLRQKRNDRAHGTMPSIEERRVMMKYAETTAGMYIDYIKLRDVHK